MQSPHQHGLALTDLELGHQRFLDAVAAFSPRTGLRMDEGGSGGGAGGGQGSGEGGSGGQGGNGSGSGGSGGGQGGTGGQGTGGAGTGSGSGSGDDEARDSQGRGLGYPANKAVSDMTDAQQAAYWRHRSQKHEGRYKDLTGDRSFDDTKKDLEELAELRKAQQTPAEQALTERYEQGKKDAKSESNNAAAKAIFDASLRTAGMKDDEVKELVDSLNVGRFITDSGDIDTSGLASFAARFKPGTGNGNNGRGGGNGGRRDFGGGHQGEGAGQAGAQPKAQLAKRFPSTQQSQNT